MPSVSWTHNRQRLLLPVAVLAPSNAPNPFDSVRIEGLLDTGATKSGIRRDVVDRLGLRPRGQRRVDTANGPIWSSEYLFRVGFMCGDYREPDFSIVGALPYVLEKHLIGFELLPGFTYPMLIGMDVIGQCSLRVDQTGFASLDLPDVRTGSRSS